MQAFPDNDAVVALHQGVRLSYRQFLEQVDQAACGLLALGIQVRPRERGRQRQQPEVTRLHVAARDRLEGCTPL